jgi:hypothetical protein
MEPRLRCTGICLINCLDNCLTVTSFCPTPPETLMQPNSARCQLAWPLAPCIDLTCPKRAGMMHHHILVHAFLILPHTAPVVIMMISSLLPQLPLFIVHFVRPTSCPHLFGGVHCSPRTQQQLHHVNLVVVRGQQQRSGASLQQQLAR